MRRSDFRGATLKGTHILEGDPIEDLFRRLDKLAAGHSEAAVDLVGALRHIYPVRSAQGGAKPNVLSKGQVDALDQHYAEEMLGKLEKVVSRASRLQGLELKTIPRPGVEVHYTEVHRCYLYGFRVACAVLCRAMLESALKEKHRPRRKAPREKRAG
jgi:hypothetical protein